MNLNWKKAEGDTPEGEVLAVSKNGGVLVGFLDEEKDGSWTCACIAYGSDYNVYLRDVRWYIKMDEFLATVPKMEET